MSRERNRLQYRNSNIELTSNLIFVNLLVLVEDLIPAIKELGLGIQLELNIPTLSRFLLLLLLLLTLLLLSRLGQLSSRLSSRG